MSTSILSSDQKSKESLRASPSLPLPDQLFSNTQKANWAKTLDAYSDTKNETNATLGGILYSVTKAAGSLASKVNGELQTYIRTKQTEKKQLEILARFYEQYNYLIREFSPPTEKQIDFRRRVENIYIEQASEESPEIDLIHFRDMYSVIRKVYADMLRESIGTGSANDYYLTGELHSIWQYKNYSPHGTVVYYDKQGEIQMIDTYREGYRTNRKKYDAQGRLSFSQDYPHPFEGSANDAKNEPGEEAGKEAPVEEYGPISPIIRHS